VGIAWSWRIHARSLTRLNYAEFRDDAGRKGHEVQASERQPRLLLIALNSVKIMVCLIPPEATRKGTYVLC
jgi:hypothetical protein